MLKSCKDLNLEEESGVRRYESCFIYPISSLFSYLFTSHVVIVISNLYPTIYILLILVFKKHKLLPYL
jgi:hypothetical protein